MTKEEIIEEVKPFHNWRPGGMIEQRILSAMQSYADQETESLRQQNTKLVEALNAAGSELLQFVPITDVKILEQINKALQA